MEVVKVGKPIMAHLLAIPHRSPIPWVSPHVPYLLPTYKPIPKSIDIDIGGLHPSLEGRGQVAASSGVWGPKKD